MPVLTTKLPESLASKLDSLVRRRGVRKSVLVREAIEKLVEESDAAPGSVLDLVPDLCGAADGPKDLSSNKKLMRGYGA